MNATSVLVVYQMASLLLLIVNGGVLLWIAITLKHAPGNNVNVRAILACIEALRVHISHIAESDEAKTEGIKGQLAIIISMIDVYILRISGVAGASRQPKVVLK